MARENINKPEIHDVSFDGLLPFVNFTVRSSSYSYKTVLSAIETATYLVRVHLDLAFCWRWISRTSTSGYYFGYFFKQAFQSCQGRWNLQKQGTARFLMSNSPIKALTLWMWATFWTRSPSKIKSLRTFNARSRHAFPIAILVLLLPKSSITKQVYSNSTFKVFHMIPHLATARIQNFFTLHVAI